MPAPGASGRARAGQGDEEDDPLLIRRDVANGGGSKQKKRLTIAGRVYKLMEEPNSSPEALVILWVVLGCIALSTILFCMETIPAYEKSPYTEMFFFAEAAFVSVFMCEYVTRMVATVASGKMSFCAALWSPLNFIDLIAILPFFVDLFLLLVMHDRARFGDLRALRTCRLVRMFKVGRYAPQLKLIGHSMARSSASLLMLLFFMVFALVAFSTLIFLVERGEWDETQSCYARGEGDCSPFDSIPKASWWTMVTITTVGYGDAFPKTDPGRWVGSVCMVFGVLAVALPTTVLGVQFADSYEEVVKESKQRELRKAEEKDEAMAGSSTRREELGNELQQIGASQAELIVTMQEIEQVLMKITEGDSRRQAAVGASYTPLFTAAVQAVENSRLFLEPYAA